MNHIQLSITATEAEQEQLIARLSELESAGFEQTDDTLIAYFEERVFKSYEVLAVIKGYDFTQASVPEKNWNAEWERSFQPVVVEDFCAVRANFHTPIDSVAHQIIITPKMSFGTGHHATTYMMMLLMRDIDFENKSVFDFGTGTGVLAILAEKLGANTVVAIDNDRWSVENALENVENNHCLRIDVYESATLPPEKKFDVILANINRNIIIEYLPALKKALNPTGYIILSGLLTIDEETIVKACAQQSLKLIKHIERNNWISLVFVNGI